MRWGVRRYQNKDGSLTPAGKARQLREAYEFVGASKKLARRHGAYRKLTSKDSKKVVDAVDRINKNEYGPNQINKLAKDYATAINGLNTLSARERLMGHVDMDTQRKLDDKIQRLSYKKQTESVRKKIEKLTSDNELMDLTVSEVMDGARMNRYKLATEKLINQMDNDSRLVYRTRKGQVAALSDGEGAYRTTGTKYKVKANTEARSKSRIYKDPKYKRRYADRTYHEAVYVI
jgi:hypothetical protein